MVGFWVLGFGLWSQTHKLNPQINFTGIELTGDATFWRVIMIFIFTLILYSLAMSTTFHSECDKSYFEICNCKGFPHPNGAALRTRRAAANSNPAGPWPAEPKQAPGIAELVANSA
jgi:hypothetical protein